MSVYEQAAAVGEEYPAEHGSEHVLKLSAVIYKDDDGNPLLTTTPPPRPMRYLLYTFVDADHPPFRQLVMDVNENTPPEQVTRNLRDMKRIIAFYGGDPNDPACFEPEYWESWVGTETKFTVNQRQRKDKETGELRDPENSVRFPKFE